MPAAYRRESATVARLYYNLQGRVGGASSGYQGEQFEVLLPGYLHYHNETAKQSPGQGLQKLSRVTFEG